ncbi:hypothetical protein LMG27174_06788 [Paraburkholderia rhynchosiae]|uniref:Uncharacterized protein n=1 Tax=Paraburkholderia rhynchosiae TaxID=487049 RepID=A0A6J5CR76_9BURK|nr:hypothetical protein LMG27174_06788 [Paraburkholderia rhynchosiae]
MTYQNPVQRRPWSEHAQHSRLLSCIRSPHRNNRHSNQRIPRRCQFTRHCLLRSPPRVSTPWSPHRLRSPSAVRRHRRRRRRYQSRCLPSVRQPLRRHLRDRLPATHPRGRSRNRCPRFPTNCGSRPTRRSPQPASSSIRTDPSQSNLSSLRSTRVSIRLFSRHCEAGVFFPRCKTDTRLKPGKTFACTLT